MTGRVQIIDDDPALRDALAWLFASRGVACDVWPSGETFLAALAQTDCACILLDVRMVGLSGPEVFDRLTAAGCTAPVIFLTGHADVPMAVQALKAGAFDFVEKPFNDNALVDLALTAIAANRRSSHRVQVRRDVQDRLATLSPREQDVMRLIVQGSLNKQIADALQIAVRTVEVHRGRVFAKMGVRNAVELGSLLAGTDWV